MKNFFHCVNLWFSFSETNFMCIKSNWKQVIAFSLSFSLGYLASSIVNFETFKTESDFQQKKLTDKFNQGFVKSAELKKSGEGVGFCRGANSLKLNKSNIELLKIVSKPRANYTDLARLNKIQDKLFLRVTFLSNGKIGNIFPVTELPNGLTEQAITAAKKIKFKPMRVDGRAVTATKQLQYNFTNY